jgi:hypothetical protein
VLRPSRFKSLLVLSSGDGGDLVEAAAVEFARRQGSAVRYVERMASSLTPHLFK